LPELGRWTYILLFFLVAIEGPIAILLASAAASAGLMRPVIVFFTAATANLTADSLWWLLGYLGKVEWILHFGRRLGIRESVIEQFKRTMIKHATRVLFLAKLTQSFGIPALITAGLLRIPWKRWIPYLILPEALWTGSLVLIGYYTTESIKRWEQGFEYGALAVSLAFVIIMAVTGRRVLKTLNRDDAEAGTG
jgi:membrane-associated protein